MTRLSEHKLDQAMLKMNGWHRRDHQIVKTYRARTHTDAVRLAGLLASELDPPSHEPSVGIRTEGASVQVDLHTPAEGGVTDADIELARRLDVVGGPKDALSPFAG